MRAIGVIAALLLVSSALAQPDTDIYARSERAAHLDRALAAFQSLGPDGARAFEGELYQAMRARCRPSGMQPPAMTCLAAAADAICAPKPDVAACAAAADVIVTNLHAENSFVPETTRMRLVAAGADYHAGVLREVRRRHELLAAELALASPGAAADGARIDRFCAERDREDVACQPGAGLCVASVPWQRCAAGLVWYVATTGASP